MKTETVKSLQQQTGSGESQTHQQGLSSKSYCQSPRKPHLHPSVCQSIQGCERL